ncbi:polysaccharide deacetylase family protein [Thalassospira sp.]|uniref:polysaccharide deacetylase family protein n=1 Tax=Thalassospira sp. TaxID=1912094 RepID=UPI0027356AE1|nr:polysaccharide deacetylase family protein [Thalassospira sp.]MDP2698105.1 polysaccharide deacetylase family protein [Thalassospira sp.]
MSNWDNLRNELDHWQEAGLLAGMWWRDDDAVEVTPALDHILALEQCYHVPLALAVVPAGVNAALVARLAETLDTRVLQHGWNHENHAPAGQKKQELDDVRHLGDVVADIRRGFDVLSGHFGNRFLPVMVPPWNRIADDVVATLPSLGIQGLSTFNTRKVAFPVPGLLQVNCHVDVIDWKGSRGFVGEDSCLAALVAHLSARRAGQADRDEATGLLTHHLVHDAPTNMFLDDLFSFEHPALKWLTIPGVFPWQ